MTQQKLGNARFEAFADDNINNGIYFYEGKENVGKEEISGYQQHSVFKSFLPHDSANPG